MGAAYGKDKRPVPLRPLPSTNVTAVLVGEHAVCQRVLDSLSTSAKARPAAKNPSGAGVVGVGVGAGAKAGGPRAVTVHRSPWTVTAVDASLWEPVLDETGGPGNDDDDDDNDDDAGGAGRVGWDRPKWLVAGTSVTKGASGGGDASSHQPTAIVTVHCVDLHSVLSRAGTGLPAALANKGTRVAMHPLMRGGAAVALLETSAEAEAHFATRGAEQSEVPASSGDARWMYSGNTIEGFVEFVRGAMSELHPDLESHVLERGAKKSCAGALLRSIERVHRARRKSAARAAKVHMRRAHARSVSERAPEPPSGAAAQSHGQGGKGGKKGGSGAATIGHGAGERHRHALHRHHHHNHGHGHGGNLSQLHHDRLSPTGRLAPRKSKRIRRLESHLEIMSSGGIPAGRKSAVQALTRDVRAANGSVIEVTSLLLDSDTPSAESPLAPRGGSGNTLQVPGGPKTRRPTLGSTLREIAASSELDLEAAFFTADADAGAHGKNGTESPMMAFRPTKVFGKPLSIAVRRSRIPGDIPLPAVVRRCIDYLDTTSLTEEGVYRLCGSKGKINELVESFDNGIDVNLLEANVRDPHIVAGLLKQYLRDLPAPVASNLTADDSDLPKLRRELKQLKEDELALLSVLVPHLRRVIANSALNKMTRDNVTIIFSSTLRMAPRILDSLVGGEKGGDSVCKGGDTEGDRDGGDGCDLDFEDEAIFPVGGGSDTEDEAMRHRRHDVTDHQQPPPPPSTVSFATQHKPPKEMQQHSQGQRESSSRVQIDNDDDGDDGVVVETDDGGRSGGHREGIVVTCSSAENSQARVRRGVTVSAPRAALGSDLPRRPPPRRWSVAGESRGELPTLSPSGSTRDFRGDSIDGHSSSSDDEDDLTDDTSEFSSSEDELYDVQYSVVEIHKEELPEFSVIDL